MRTIVLLLPLSLLAACSNQPEAVATDGWTRWVCETQVEVLWRYTNSQHEAIDMRLGGDDIVHRLRRQTSASGALYSDPLIAFHSKGDEAVIYRPTNKQVIGRFCKAP
ncbi:MliC family protein [Ectopseudomonas mendocina]|uniref:MliC family protein n=1 Tax=Ectopseudomonas mendocina TaxID=300 RepID=A0ABZ2RFX8_ECTME